MGISIVKIGKKYKGRDVAGGVPLFFGVKKRKKQRITRMNPHPSALRCLAPQSPTGGGATVYPEK
jgi:hypothetical protein